MRVGIWRWTLTASSIVEEVEHVADGCLSMDGESRRKCTETLSQSRSGRECPPSESRRRRAKSHLTSAAFPLLRIRDTPSYQSNSPLKALGSYRQPFQSHLALLECSQWHQVHRLRSPGLSSSWRRTLAVWEQSSWLAACRP